MPNLYFTQEQVKKIIEKIARKEIRLQELQQLSRYRWFKSSRGSSTRLAGRNAGFFFYCQGVRWLQLQPRIVIAQTGLNIFQK